MSDAGLWVVILVVLALVGVTCFGFGWAAHRDHAEREACSAACAPRLGESGNGTCFCLTPARSAP